MKILGMEVQELHAVEDISSWIPAKSLMLMCTDRKRLNFARHKAAQVLCDARRRGREILLHARQQAALEQEREMIELRALLQQDTQQAIAESVIWMVNELQLEERIATVLQEKAVQWAADTLKAWGASLDWDALIAERIQLLSRQQPDSGILVLSCHPESVSRVQALLDDTLPLRIEAQHDLEPGHAILENSLVRIDINLREQLEFLASDLKTRIDSTILQAGDNCGFE